jgi:Family of unknown function (DUF6311)
MKTKKEYVKHNNLILLIVAIFWGSLYSFYLLGNHLSFTNTNWVFNHEDVAQAMIGWEYFRNDSWYWPLTYTKYVAYPTGSAISYTDSIPIVAIVLKLFSSILPKDFQYFGFFILSSLILQFFWGAKLGSLFSKNNLFYSTAAGLLFMIASPLTWRVHGHISLTCQWVILAAIWTYFKLQFTQNKHIINNLIFYQAILILFTTGIHPYLSIMTLAFIVFSHIQLLWLKKVSILKGSLLIVLFPILMILGWYFFGYLMTNSNIGDSYGDYSLNLNSLFNPNGCLNPTGSCSQFLNSLPFHEGQYEGFNYLGLGVILLLLANIGFIIFKRNKIDFEQVVKALISKQSIVLAVLILLVFTLSLSNKIYLGNHHIVSYYIPEKTLSILSKFRSSGRLFWMVHYLMILGVLVVTFRLWNSRQVKFLLVLVLCIQFIDLRPLHISSTKKMNSASSLSAFKSPLWNELYKDYNKLIILPSTQCEDTNIYPTFEKIAALQHLKTNSARLARYTSKDLDFHCHQLPKLVFSEKLEKDAVYVLDSKKYFNAYAKINSDPKGSHFCSEVDGYIVCQRRNSSTKIKPLVLNFSNYKISQTINFTKENNNSLQYQYGDWSGAEPDGTWTNGPQAHVIMKVDQPIKKNLILKVKGSPFLNEKHLEQKVDILINNHFLTKWVFKNGDKFPPYYEAFIPNKLINNISTLEITFRIINPVSPINLGLSDDNRLLGLFVKNIQLIEIEE